MLELEASRPIADAQLRVCGEGRSSAFRRRPGCGLVSKLGPHADTLSSSSRARAGARELKITISCFGRPSELMANAVRHAASALPSIRHPHLHAHRARSRPLRVFRRAHHVDMSRVHRRAGIAEHRRRTAEQVRIEQTNTIDRAAEAALSCDRRPSRRPRPCSRIQLTCAALRACARAGVVVACGLRCCWAAAWRIPVTTSARCT